MYNAEMPVKIDKLMRMERKSITLVVEADGSLTVRAPLHAGRKLIDEVVAKHEAWIRARREHLQSNPLGGTHHYAEGEGFLYLGRSYPLHIADLPRPSLALEGERFTLARALLPQAARAFEVWYRVQAQRLLPERVNFYAKGEGLVYQQVKITAARTRWGSCSRRGSLCFTWRLVMAPPPVIDYVAVHELAHLRQHNHSALFWAEVQRILPGYLSLQQWLKDNGRTLFL